MEYARTEIPNSFWQQMLAIWWVSLDALASKAFPSWFQTRFPSAPKWRSWIYLQAILSERFPKHIHQKWFNRSQQIREPRFVDPGAFGRAEACLVESRGDAPPGAFIRMEAMRGETMTGASQGRRWWRLCFFFGFAPFCFVRGFQRGKAIIQDYGN